MMNLSSEIIEFKAHDFLEEFPVSLIERSNGFAVVNEGLQTVHGPFETVAKARETMAELWDEEVECSRTGFVRRERVYHGRHDEHGKPVITYKLCEVSEDTLSPDESWKVKNHSPVGLDWNNKYGGAAQLALALLLEHYPSEVAQDHYHRFKRAVVWSLPEESWSLPEKEIRVWMEKSQLDCIGN
jgi:hypothetical protein